ncbi:MAG TPA: hypothetical protein GXZ60_06390 [Intrasporangiaceae bacterium]|nr:hypothetical protein [Intrasporangiaceae bacterium]
MSESNREDLPDEGAPFDPTAEIPYPSTYSGSQTPPEPAPPPAPNPYAAPPASSFPPPPSSSPDAAPEPPSPYGTPPAFGAPPPPPTGQSSPYGDPSVPYGTPPPAYYQTQAPQSNTSALVLTIISGIGVFACCAVTIIPLILGVVALAKQTTEPEQSAKFAKWGWISFAITIVLAILAVIAVIVLGTLDSATGY